MSHLTVLLFHNAGIESHPSFLGTTADTGKKVRALSAFAYLEQLQTKHCHQQVTVVCERQEVKKTCS